MRTQTSMKPIAAPIHTVAQQALRAAVHAESERDGIDLLANGLLKVCDLATSASISASQRHAEHRCHVGDLAIMSTRFGTRVVRVKGRAADLCYDWKVEVLGSPIWGIDARSFAPAFTNLALVGDGQLSPLLANVGEADHPDNEEVCYG